jgi:DNA-binding NtrC family response regulator
MAKILVIDDERAIRNTLKEILEFEWRIGNPEDNQQSSILIKVLPTDKFGYLFIQISIKSCNTFDLDKYNKCSMYIKTEIGSFERFGRHVSKLKQRENNIVVSLAN